ncbi:MAG: phosphate acyltransferase PlsX [Oscillospiraceae bacterium]|nr:phosphate acyltransferase PlsX [Oscillospiraceae bacterium]
MKIIVDAMGGDNAPHEIVKGAVEAHKQFGYEIVLVGKEDAVKECLKNEGALELSGITVKHAGDVIDMNDEPTAAIRRKKDSSMVVALNMLQSGEGDAVVSAGSTGALLTGATLLVRRINGIRRACLAPCVPNIDKGFVLIDAGANAECVSDQLVEFAYMGSLYSERVLGVSNPRVGLLNNGAEEHKGTPMHQETYQLLTKAKGINFVGNVEGSGVQFGDVDVVVSDGFSGNILLKSMEGTAKLVMKLLKEAMYSSLKNKLAALMIKKDLAVMKDRMDPNRVGGTALLGVSKPVIKAHGSSTAPAIVNAIKQAATFTESGFIKALEENIVNMRADDAQ